MPPWSVNARSSLDGSTVASPSLFGCIVSSAVCRCSVATYLTGCLHGSWAEAPQKHVQKMDLKRCAGEAMPVRRADESRWAHPCSYVVGSEKPRLRRGPTVKNGMQSFPVKKDILSAHMRLEQNQLIRCILWGLNDDLRVMIFNGCLHIAKENPSALQNQARG